MIHPSFPTGPKFQGAIINMHSDNPAATSKTRLFSAGNPSIADDEVRFTVKSNGQDITVQLNSPLIKQLSEELLDVAVFEEKLKGVAKQETQNTDVFSQKLKASAAQKKSESALSNVEVSDAANKIGIDAAEAGLSFFENPGLERSLDTSVEGERSGIKAFEQRLAQVVREKRQQIAAKLPEAFEKILSNPESYRIDQVYAERVNTVRKGQSQIDRSYYADLMGPATLQNHGRKLVDFLKRNQAAFLPESSTYRKGWFSQAITGSSQAMEWKGTLNPPPPQFVQIQNYQDFEQALESSDTSKRYLISGAGLVDVTMNLRKKGVPDSAIETLLEQQGIPKEITREMLNEEKHAMTLDEAKAELARLSQNIGEPEQVTPQRLLDILTELCGEPARQFLELIEQRKIAVEPMPAAMAYRIRDELADGDIEYFIDLYEQDLVKVEAPTPNYPDVAPVHNEPSNASGHASKPSADPSADPPAA